MLSNSSNAAEYFPFRIEKNAFPQTPGADTGFPSPVRTRFNASVNFATGANESSE